MAVPIGTTLASVIATSTLLRYTSAGLMVGVVLTVPTTKPALVIVVLATAGVVPRSYCGFSGFS